MILTVERLKPTAKSLVLTCGGQEYFAKKESGIAAGMTIDAETEVSDYNGKTYTWVKKWRPALNAAPQATSGNGSATATSAHQSAVAAPVWANFVSNQVAHAIQAGRIDDPAQIKIWAAAAKQAFTELL